MAEEQKLTREELYDKVREIAQLLPEKTREDTTTLLAEELLTDPKSRTARGPIIPAPFGEKKYYVVPGEDLRLARSAVAIAAGLATVLPNPIPLIATVCLTIFQFTRLSITLTKHEGLIIMMLLEGERRKEGMTLDQIAKNLPDGVLLLEADILRILTDLEHKHSQDSLTTVVEKRRDRWYAHDIWSLT